MNLPFGISMAARTEAVFGLLFLAGGGALYYFADSLTSNVPYFSGTATGALLLVAMMVMLAGVLDITCAIALTRLNPYGFVIAISASIASFIISIYLLLNGFTMGVMNIFINLAVPIYIVRWEVRQEYI